MTSDQNDWNMTRLFEPIRMDRLTPHRSVGSGRGTVLASGAARLSELEERLREGLRPLCPEGGALARFVNPLWLLRKNV